MTNQQKPEALRLADALESRTTSWPDKALAATKLRRLHAENTTLQQGYDAARLEIEALQARIKAMAEERADELAVAHLDGRMRAGQPAPVMFNGLTEEETMNTASYAGLTTKLAGEYPPLPKPYHVAYDDIDKEDVKCFTEGQLRAYVDADRAMRAAQPEGAQQPGTAYAVLPEIDRVIGRLASSDPDFPDCEDAVVLLRKYRKLCQEIGRGDSHHLDRIEKAAIAVESRAPHGQAPAQAEPAISAGDAVFAFASMLTDLPHVIPFGAAAWATPGVELATAFNAANGFSVSQNFPDGLVFPKITGDLLAVVETAAAPVAQGDEDVLTMSQALFAQREADAEDAARYRWLRRWKGQEHEPPFTVQHEVDGTLWGGDLDAAVDAARKQGATT